METLAVGTRVKYRGSWRRDIPKLGTIIGCSEKNDQLVYDVELDNGEVRWGYADQFEKV